MSSRTIEKYLQVRRRGGNVLACALWHRAYDPAGQPFALGGDLNHCGWITFHPWQ
jgi:hypothetical protein